MRHFLAALISVAWCGLCLWIAGPIDTGWSSVPDQRSDRETRSPARSPEPPAPSFEIELRIKRIEGLLPDGPGDPWLLRGRPPSGVLS